MGFKALTVNTPVEQPAHILAEDDATLYNCIIGSDCVLPVGGLLNASVITNNTVRITDGMVVVGGHVGRLVKGDYEDMPIANGQSGLNRNDLIVARFISGGTGGADTYELVTVQGTPGKSASDPAIVRGNLYAGEKQRDYPLWRVRLEGLSVAGIDKLYTVGMMLNNKQDLLEKGAAKGSINDIKVEGVYWVRKTEVADSIYDYGQLIVQKSSDGTITQMLVQYQLNSISGRIATRFFADGKWSYWFENVLRADVANNLTTASEGSVLDARQGKALKDLLDSRTNNKVKVFTDAEGGNIVVESPDKYGDTWQMDAYNGSFRLFHQKDGVNAPAYFFDKNGASGAVLTDAKLANNVVTTATGYALDARQGKSLKGLIDGITSAVNLLKSIYSNGSALKFNGESKNLLYSSYDMGIYYFGGSCAGAPSVYTGYMLVLRQHAKSNLVRVVFSTDGRIYYCVQSADGTVVHNWRAI